jgi:pyridoxamine 5'-phosphate oxidase
VSDQAPGYSLRALRREALAADPIEQFEAWFQAAKAAGVAQPDAMTLATATQDGTPSARMVILRGFDARGFVFYTNYESQKGQELTANPRAALVFYWQEMGRQIRVSGRVSEVSQAASERYFRGRPRESQLAAWASDQSHVIPSREFLEQRLERLRVEYADEAVPLPPAWGGFRVSPDSIEFWQQRPNRLHDRFRYTRQADGTWQIDRLAP